MKGPSITLVLVLLGLSWAQMTAPVFASTGQQRARHAASKMGKVTRAHPTRVNFAGVPLSFEKNVGQLDGNIKFLARAEGYSLFLTTTGAIMLFRVPVPAPVMQSHRALLRPQARNVRWTYGSRRLEMQFVAANGNSRVIPGEQLPAKSNYFISRDPTRWWKGVPNYSTVEYRDLYPGVDLIYRGVQSELEYDFIVQPGHNPRSIALTFRKVAGVKIDPNGNLIVRASGGELKLHKPFAYQEYADGKHAVAAHYALTDTGLASFEVGGYDRSRPLVIDPSLSYSTYLGGSGVEHSGGLAIDASGNVYITGETASTDFVTSGAPQPANAGGQDAFITKLNAAGNAVVYSTFLGGSGDDAATGIAVDGAGNAYVTGNTNSANFPVSNALQSSLKGDQDIFVTKLNPAGSALLYSTYVSGTGGDSSASIAVDSSGNAYVAGITSSSDFPLSNPLQTKRNGASDAVIFKLNPAGSALVYSTLLGGGATDSANAIAVDATGNAFVGGSTTSTDFPVTPGAFQRKCGCSLHGGFYYYYGPITEGWVAKISPSGSSLLYSTYLGGQSSDSISGIAVDTAGNAVVTGSTSSSDFPVANAAYPRAPGSTNAFVTKFNSTGSGLLFSTFLGGKDLDSGSAVVVDGTGNAYVAGTTSSTDFPVKNTFQATLGGASDGFIAKMDPAGGVVYSSYLGGIGNDTCTALAVDGSGNVYIVGDTDSTNFPTHSPLQPNLGGASGDADAFVTKVSPADATGADLSINTTAVPTLGTRGGTVTYTHTVANHGPDNATGVTLTIAIPAGMVLASSSPSQGTCSGSPLICDLGIINNGSIATVATMVTTPNGGLFKEVASVTATQPDSSSGNNLAVTNTEVDADFAVEATPSSITVSAGNPATYSVKLSAKDGPFSSDIALSCSQLPPFSSCNVSPNSINLGSDPTATGTVKLLVLTTATFTASSRGFPFPVSALWMPIALGLAGMPRRRSWKRGVVVMLFSCLLLLLMLQPACSSGSSQQTTIAGTPSGTYHVTLTAASGTTSHTTQVTVVVK